MRFRPCIDLRLGKVVQIVGGSLAEDSVRTNFESDKSPDYYAQLYRKDRLPGGHVISLGPGNKQAAISALKAYPQGLQYGGGVTPENAEEYLSAGASHVIVTSYIFSQGEPDIKKLEKLSTQVEKFRLVLDLSCRFKDDAYWVVTDRWQKFSSLEITQKNLEHLAQYCDEFLVHGVDVEGKRLGIQKDLIPLLADFSPVPVTYAGGARELSDLDLVYRLGRGKVDLTIGSALDIFGGSLSYREVVAWQRKMEQSANT
jgi:phosphoribosylformimino-5-aminoimidazole carboxamide ribotide isomerase